MHKLADSISQVGLLNPITVDRDYTLIAGLHRLEAAKMLGWTEIECMVSDLDGLQAELAELDENFVRAVLSPVDYGNLFLRRKEIYEILHPETKNGGDRRSEDFRTKNFRSDSAKSFVQDTAEKIGVTPRTVELQVQMAKNLTPEAKAIIKDTNTKITKTDGMKLSRLPPEQQSEVAAQLAAGDIHSVDQYQSTQAKPNEAVQEPNEPPLSASPSVPEGYYPTIKDSIDDLKKPDKDRSHTPDTFLMSLSFFLQRFCQGVVNYASPEYASVFPALSQEQMNQIRQEINSTCAVLHNLFHQIEGMMHK